MGRTLKSKLPRPPHEGWHWAPGSGTGICPWPWPCSLSLDHLSSSLPIKNPHLGLERCLGVSSTGPPSPGLSALETCLPQSPDPARPPVPDPSSGYQSNHPLACPHSASESSRCGNGPSSGLLHSHPLPLLGREAEGRVRAKQRAGLCSWQEKA